MKRQLFRADLQKQDLEAFWGKDLAAELQESRMLAIRENKQNQRASVKPIVEKKEASDASTIFMRTLKG